MADPRALSETSIGRFLVYAGPVGCINSVRPAESRNLQGESSSRYRSAAETLTHPQAPALAAKYHFQLRFVSE
jgi:hypothetical protein